MLSTRQTGVLLLQMAALGLSIPFDGEIELMKRTNIPWQNMSTYKDYNWDDLCNNYDPVNGKHTAEELWKDLGIGAWFDDWLMTHEDKNYWANTMDNEVNNNGRTQYSTCHELLSDSCNAPDDCKFYVENGAGPAWWVLQSVSSMHDGLIYLHEGLQDGTITSGLQVDDMVQKFGLDPDVGGDINVMAALAAAFTMAAGASAAAAPISGPLTVVAGVFSLASLFTPSPTDPTAAVSVQLSDAFKAAEHSVEQTAALIFGSKQNAGSWMDLPEQIGDYRDAMARFIAEGRFIGVNMNDRLKEISTEWTRRQQQNLAAWFIGHMGYIVTVATNKNNQADCEAMNMWSTYWQEPTSRCFNVMKYNPGGWGIMPLKVDDGPMSVAMNDYGMDKDEFYSNAYGCAEAFPDGDGKISGDIADIPTDGTLPLCFFNVPLTEGWIGEDGDGWAYLRDVKLNSAHAKGNRMG